MLKINYYRFHDFYKCNSTKKNENLIVNKLKSMKMYRSSKPMADPKKKKKVRVAQNTSRKNSFFTKLSINRWIYIKFAIIRLCDGLIYDAFPMDL